VRLLTLSVTLCLLLGCTQEIPTADLVIEGVNAVDVTDETVADNMAFAIADQTTRAGLRFGVHVPGTVRAAEEELDIDLMKGA